MSNNFLGSCFATVRLFMTMSIISGLSCTQSAGDTTATVANIFQHEKSATRLEVDVFHNRHGLSPGRS